MNSARWVAVAVAGVCALTGSVMVVLRSRVGRWSDRATARLRGAPPPPGDRTTPGMVTVLGVMLVLMGAVGVFLAITIPASRTGASHPHTDRLLGIVLSLPFVAAIVVLRVRDARVGRRRPSATRPPAV